MAARNEGRKRERLSRFSLAVSLAALVPLVGVALAPVGILAGATGLYLARRFPERTGGLVRLRTSLVISVLALMLSTAELHVFVKIKLKQANDSRYELTRMRLLEARESLERYEESTGVYPEGTTVPEIETAFGRAGMETLPMRDGWDRELLIKSEMWDYTLTAKKTPESEPRDFPSFRGKDPKPVFPFIGPSGVFPAAAEQVTPGSVRNGSQVPQEPPPG